MPKKGVNLGGWGEKLATDFLESKGYKIISQNYKVKFGEIDIVALDKDRVCFIEVKSRRSARFGLGRDAITGLKQRQISKVAVSFLKENCYLNRKARFDVVEVDFSFLQPKLTLVRNAFEINKEFNY